MRAHEEFLAGDAMGGRGSATRLEKIGATYASRRGPVERSVLFVCYGSEELGNRVRLTLAGIPRFR